MVEGGASSLSKLDILVAQLESIVASAASQHPDPLICFDLLSDLLSSLQDHPKETIVGCQRKCEDALQSLLLLGARPPVRRLAAKVLIQIIEKGDNISIYSRASSLQGWLSEMKKVDTSSYIGATNCLGALYRSFGQKITSGLPETSNIVVKLMRFSEVSVRQAALQLLQDALEGSGGGGSISAYAEALRAVLRIGAVDRSPAVRTAAAGCLRAFAFAGGPGLGAGGLENCCSICVKALEDPSHSVRDAYATALGFLLALGLNPEAQIQARGKSHSTPTKTLEGGLQKHLTGPFMRATGSLSRDVRVGLTMAWVAFLQGMHLTYGHSDTELQNYALQAMGMLTFNSRSQTDAHSQACVLYILRVGVVEQMSEPVQKEFLLLLTKQLSLADTSSSMLVVILRTISHLLAILGEVPTAAREALEDCLVVALSNSTMAVRVETALTIRGLAEVDPSCAYNLMSFGITTMRALRETVAIEKGDRLRVELDSLHGHAMMLAALSAASAKLPLGVPSRLPAATLEVAKSMVLENGRNPSSAGIEKEAGWLLIAAIVSSLSQEELKEQEFDIIALWTVPFGGNFESRLKKAETNLSAEICGWSAAVEALTAFVKSYVNPSLSSQKEGILLQPVLGYLSGALTYLSSPLLQKAPNDLKQMVDLFAVRTLTAYQSLPDPFAYRSDHNALLSICTDPFREPSLWEGSSSLRQLLDSRDASLGPWVPGRDSSEDELRAFDGGSDGPLPCVWENETIVFPQPLSGATLLLNQMMLCFGVVFIVQREARKLQLLDMLENSLRSSKKQAYHEANTNNVSVALLAALKAALGMRVGYEPELFRRMQLIFQGLLAEESTTSAQRRAAAEGLGILARLGNDVFAARLMRSLLMDAAGASDINLKGSIAFACGCVHRSKGGMALSVLVPATVQTMCKMARDPKDSLRIWSLHGLWLTIEAAGLAYVPYVQATMSLAMDILLSEEHAGPELQQSIGRLVNAIVAVTGPELSPGSSFFSRCKAVLAEVTSGVEPAVLLESVLFTQQLVLFAPQAVSVHTHVQALTSTLQSRQPSLRQAAVSTLHHLAERDPESVIEEHIEENLFAMLDTETDPGIIKLVRVSLLCLLEAACPSCPSRWLHLCRNVILATSTTIAAGGRSGRIGNGYQNIGDASTMDQALGDDEEGMIVRFETSTQGSSSAGGFGSMENKPKEGEQLPRYSTRLFAAECLSRLPTAAGQDPRHFNLFLAKQNVTQNALLKASGDWLVLQLGQLVALAYQVATGVFESMRPKGVLILVTILQKFGATEDPDLNGHLLLEQYQAQFFSAVRTALDSSAGPTLLDAGLQLAARIITSGISNGDVGVFRRMMTLMSRLLNNFEELQYPSYAELIGCKVQISLLGAYAAIKSYANVCARESQDKMEGGVALIELLANNLAKMKDFWIGLLKDYMLIRITTPSQLQLKYKPFLNGFLLPAVVSAIQPYLDDVWPAVLEAVTTNAISEMANANQDHANTENCSQICLSTVDFHEVWALCFFLICQGNTSVTKRLASQSSFSTVSFKTNQSGVVCGISAEQVIAIHAMHSLCKTEFYYPSLLTSSIYQELFQVLMVVCFSAQLPASVHIMPILNQAVKTAPDDFCKKSDDDWLLKAIEMCMYYAHQALHSFVAEREFMEVESMMCSIFETLEIAICKLTYERKRQVISISISMGMRLITLNTPAGSSLSAAIAFIRKAVTLTVQAKVDEQQTILTSAVESLVALSRNILIDTTIVDDFPKIVDERTLKLPMLLGLMIDITQISMSSSLEESSTRNPILAECTECLRCTLISPYSEFQLAGLQALRSLAQRSIAEHKQEASYVLALLLLGELGASVVGIVDSTMKTPLTAKAATAVGESLKLLLLLHSLVDGDEAQEEVLHVLLPAVITAASTNGRDEFQIAAGLQAVAVKLVTHLASQPESAAQFRRVLLEMPVHLRQKLQDIIRVSISQNAPTTNFPPTSSFSTDSRRLVIPMPPVGSSLQAAKPSSVPILADNGIDDEDEDDDWDDFQSFSVSEAPQAESEQNQDTSKGTGELAADAADVQDERVYKDNTEIESLTKSDDSGDSLDILPGDVSTCVPDASKGEDDFDPFQGCLSSGSGQVSVALSVANEDGEDKFDSSSAEHLTGLTQASFASRDGENDFDSIDGGAPAHDRSKREKDDFLPHDTSKGKEENFDSFGGTLVHGTTEGEEDDYDSFEGGQENGFDSFQDGLSTEPSRASEIQSSEVDKTGEI